MATTQPMRWIKQCARWTLPPGFQDLGRGVKRLVQETSFASRQKRAILDRNRRLCGCHQGQRCFILACGPSIKEQDLKPLKGEICISVSNFFVHPDYNLIRPQYHCLPAWGPEVKEEIWDRWVEEMRVRTGNAVIFFAFADRDRNKGCENREVYYLDFSGSLEDMAGHGLDLCRPVPGPATASGIPLEVAVYMGFREIYLLGFDHDWVLHIGHVTNFYPLEQHVITEGGSHDPGVWDRKDLEPLFGACFGLWQQYKAIHAVASSKGISIFNATRGGLLDVFPRVQYESLFDR